jgi:hypothetical protein
VWGHTILRSRIKASLRQSIGALLKEDLHLYGMALSQWSGQIVRKLELLINSYADAYPDQIEADLKLLRSWRPASSPTLPDTRA